MRILVVTILFLITSAARAQPDDELDESQRQMEDGFFITQPQRERLEDVPLDGGRIETRPNGQIRNDFDEDDRRHQNLGAEGTPNIPGAAGTPNIPGAAGTPRVPGAGTTRRR